MIQRWVNDEEKIQYWVWVFDGFIFGILRNIYFITHKEVGLKFKR